MHHPCLPRPPRLTGISLAAGGNPVTLSPSFAVGTLTGYAATVPNAATSLSVTAICDTAKIRRAKAGSWSSDGTTPLTNLTEISSSGSSVAVNLASSSDTRVALEVTGQADNNPAFSNNLIIVSKELSNANLSAPAASTAESASGTHSPLDVGTFAAGTTSYSATVPHATTHAKLTPTAAHSAAAVEVQGTTVPRGTASEAIALSAGDNALTVRVTAQDGATTKDYTVTLTRQQQAAPEVSLSAAPNPLMEGSAVTVTATLTVPLAAGVTIPLTLADHSAEPSDHGISACRAST